MGLRLRFAKLTSRVGCFMSESTTGTAAPVARATEGAAVSGGGLVCQGWGLGGAYISGWRVEGGAWGSVAAGRAGRRPRGPSRGERASGGAEDPIHSLGRPMGRSRVNAFGASAGRPRGSSERAPPALVLTCSPGYSAFSQQGPRSPQLPLLGCCTGFEVTGDPPSSAPGSGPQVKLMGLGKGFCGGGTSALHSGGLTKTEPQSAAPTSCDAPMHA